MLEHRDIGTQVSPKISVFLWFGEVVDGISFWVMKNDLSLGDMDQERTHAGLLSTLSTGVLKYFRPWATFTRILPC